MTVDHVATAEAFIAAPVVDLYLGLWRRRSHATLDVRGATAQRFLAGPESP